MEVGVEMDSRIKPDLLSYFQRIVADWDPDDRPAFRARKKITDKEAVLYVYPTGPGKVIWNLVSITGAKPHPIVAKVKRWLGFIWGGPGSYKHRTTASGGYKGPGEPSGDWVRFKRVQHPGFKARNFEKHVARWYRPKFYKYMENAFRRGIRRAKASARR
jgi:hypothetical protein